jgi:hypothetical protein
LFYRQRFTFGWRGRRLIASDVPVPAQIADVVGGEAMTVSGGALLPIENAGNDGGPVAGLVGIEGGVVSGVTNLESPGVEALGRRPRHEECYQQA